MSIKGIFAVWFTVYGWTMDWNMKMGLSEPGGMFGNSDWFMRAHSPASFSLSFLVGSRMWGFKRAQSHLSQTAEECPQVRFLGGLSWAARRAENRGFNPCFLHKLPCTGKDCIKIRESSWRFFVNWPKCVMNFSSSSDLCPSLVSFQF